MFHGTVVPQLVGKTNHRGVFLPDGDINTENARIFLVNNGIDGDFGFPGLTVADNQLALTATDGDHTVDGLDPGL